MKKFANCLLFVICFLLYSDVFSQFYNGSQMDFGKNRVQYNESHAWQWYKYEKCNVYFYMGGKELAMYTSKRAKQYISEIEKFLDYNLDDKILFMVYNKQSDFKQSNVGLETEDPSNIGGVTRIVGSKVSLYFNGDHDDFDKQIKAGIAEVLINQMMYGGSVKDVLKSSALLNLPNWYIQGLVSYIANDWNTDIDSRVKDGILANKYKRFNGLEGIDAIYAGHSIWNYIAETYGVSVISNILYMTKVTRNIESAFLFVLGVSMKNMTSEWMQYYTDRYNEADTTKALPVKSILKRIKIMRVYQHLKISPDGNYAIYTTNELGQYKVWLYDFKRQKAKRIMKHEKKLDRPADYTFPLIAWHPSGKLFSIVTERKGQMLLSYYTLSTKKLETINIFNFEKILDFSYSDDGKKFVMSAVQNGQSDIYVYNPGTASFEQITKDIYDDLNPKFIDGSSKIIFSSNRANDTIRFMAGYTLNLAKNLQPMNQKDIFIYNYSQKNPVLRRVTNTPLVNESYPCEFDKDHLCFLSDENGIRNRYLGILDSSIAYVDTAEHYRYFTRTYPITNYSRNIQEQDINLKSKKIGEVVFDKKKYRMYMSDMPEASTQLKSSLENTPYKSYVLKELSKQKELKKENEEKVVQNVQVIVKEEKQPIKDTTGIDIDNYTFENEPKKTKQPVLPPPSQLNSSPDTASAISHVPSFQLPKQRNYFTFFSTDYVVTQLDNSYLNPVYQKFTGPPPPGQNILNPGISGFFKIGLSDLFDDYKITGGVRISADLNSNEYFMSFENRLKRIDKQLILHRQALLDIANGVSLVKIHTHDAQYILKYPFSETSCLKGTISLRDDRTVFLATDDYNLAQLNTYEYWGGSKLEYIYDDTRKRGLNLYYGTRLKLFAEYYKQINQQEKNMEVIGCDIRHYTKIHRDFIWASRFAASTSLGTEKLIYYMGGVDNWLSPKFDYNIPISTTENYAFQTLATPMRGFIQNIRNGNSFAVANNELRLPIFRYLMNRPLKSDFLNNFQIIGFGDVGTAWTGKSPYDDNNSLNTQTYGGPPSPVTVVVQTKVEPIVFGYGWGLRSRILGYFIRLDWAHGWQDGKVGPRVFYLSTSLDF